MSPEQFEKKVKVPNYFNDESLSAFVRFAKEIGNTFLKIQSSDFMKGFYDAISSVYKAIDDMLNDPNSYHSFQGYEGKLGTFLWAWPYGIQPEEIKRLLEDANSEEDFDKIMVSFFNKKRMKEMFSFIKENIPSRHKCLIMQIEKAYWEKQYALINNATISIIDNLFLESLVNKSITKRKGILHPIIKFYRNTYGAIGNKFLFYLEILSNNIDLIFNNYNFSKKISVVSNKKARRHLTAHGIMYSNKKEDTIMLLNTVAAILANMKYIQPFKNALIYDKKKKEFVLGTREIIIKNRVNKELDLSTFWADLVNLSAKNPDESKKKA